MKTKAQRSEVKEFSKNKCLFGREEHVRGGQGRGATAADTAECGGSSQLHEGAGQLGGRHQEEGRRAEDWTSPAAPGRTSPAVNSFFTLIPLNKVQTNHLIGKNYNRDFEYNHQDLESQSYDFVSSN